MRGKNAAAALAVAASMLLLVPMATAQGDPAHPNKSTPTSLYFHIFDVFNAFPINTQPQNEDFFKVGGTNFPSAVEPNSNTNYDFNTIYGYSTSGPVEYDFIENGQPRFHPERGIAATVNIDTGAPATVYLYVSVRDVIGTELAPNYMPSYTFRVEMKERNVLGDEAYLDAGKTIMSGSKTAHLLATRCVPNVGCPDSNAENQTLPHDPNTPVLVPNQDGVIEYAIPMTIASGASIPAKDAYHMRIDWYQNPSGQADQDDRYAEGYMRLVSNNTYRPRLDLSIKNPIYIDFVHPQVAAGIVLIHTAMNSPWGTYDVDVENVTVQIKDSSDQPMRVKTFDAKNKLLYDSGGSGTEVRLTQVTSQNAHVHNLHDKSAEVTYLWRYRDEGLPDGRYSIQVSVQNVAHTATATAPAEFVLEGKEVYGVDQSGNLVTAAPGTEETESSPGAGMLVLAVLVGLAVLVRRRGA